MVGELAGGTKRFRGITAVDGVDLRLEAGKVAATLGPNGAGKTTTVRLLLGLTRPTSRNGAPFRSGPDIAGRQAANRRDAAGGERPRDAARPRAYAPVLQLLHLPYDR